MYLFIHENRLLTSSRYFNSFCEQIFHLGDRLYGNKTGPGIHGLTDRFCCPLVLCCGPSQRMRSSCLCLEKLWSQSDMASSLRSIRKKKLSSSTTCTLHYMFFKMPFSFFFCAHVYDIFIFIRAANMQIFCFRLSVFLDTTPLTRYLKTDSTKSDRTWQSYRFPWGLHTEYVWRRSALINVINY